MKTTTRTPRRQAAPFVKVEGTPESDYPRRLARLPGFDKYVVTVGGALKYRKRPGKRMHPYVASGRFEAMRRFGRPWWIIEDLGAPGASLLELTDSQLEAWENLVAYRLEVFFWQVKAAAAPVLDFESRSPIRWDGTPFGEVVSAYRNLSIQFRWRLAPGGFCDDDGKRVKVRSILDIAGDHRKARAAEASERGSARIDASAQKVRSPSVVPRHREAVTFGEALKRPNWNGVRAHPYAASPRCEAAISFRSCCDHIEELGPPGAHWRELTDEQLEAWEQLAAYHLEMFYWHLDVALSSLLEFRDQLPDSHAWGETPFGWACCQFTAFAHDFREWIVEDGNPYDDPRKRVRSIVKIARASGRGEGRKNRVASLGEFSPMR